MTEDQLNRACGVAPNDMPGDDKALQIGRKWLENSSLEQWFPFTAKQLYDLIARVNTLGLQLIDSNTECDMKDKRIVELKGDKARMDWLCSDPDGEVSFTIRDGVSRLSDARCLRAAIDEEMSKSSCATTVHQHDTGLLPGLHEALRLAHVFHDNDLVVGRIMKRISELEKVK